MKLSNGGGPRLPGILWASVAVALMAIALIGARLILAWNGILTADGARDLVIAHHIVQGEEFPLIGPEIGNTIHLGPLYYYIVAFPFALFGTATAVICFLSLLSLAALPFAYWIGELLFNRRVAILFVLLYSSDFFYTLSGIQVGNSDLIPLVSLAFLYPICAAIVRREPRYLGWAVVAGALALQIHPTTACFLPLLGLASVLPMPRGKARSLAWGLAIALCFYLPYLGYQVAHDYEDFRRFLTYAQQEMPAATARSTLSVLPQLLWNHLFFSPFMAAGYSGMVEPQWAREVAVTAAYGISLLALLGGVLLLIEAFRRAGRCGDPTPKRAYCSERRLGAMLVMLWLICGWLVIPRLHPTINWYYLHPIHPALFLLAAVALDFGGRQRSLSWFPYLSASLCFCATLWLAPAAFLSFARAGIMRTPQALTYRNMDLRVDAGQFAGETIMPYLGAWQEEAATRLLLQLGRDDPDLIRKLHGLPLWSLIQSRAILFLSGGVPLDKEASVKEGYHRPGPLVDPQRRYLGIRKADLPGRPLGETISSGPLWLVRYHSPLVYDSLYIRFSPNGPRQPIAVPAYTLPDPRVTPPEPDHVWPSVPVFVEGELNAQPSRAVVSERMGSSLHTEQAARRLGQLFFGIASPVIAPWIDQAEVKKIVVNGQEIGSPWRDWPYLKLYNVTPYLQEGKGAFVVELDGPHHFVLDLFAVEVTDTPS